MADEYLSEIESNFMITPNEIWDIGLTPSEFIVLSRILMRSGIKSGKCFESRNSVADACKMSTKTVSAVFTELENLNIIENVHRKSENKPNLIRVKSVAQWRSKRKNFPQKDLPRENISLALGKLSNKAREIKSHGTISIELDPFELDQLNTLTPEKSVVPRSNSTQIFEAYKEAYERRYKVEPLRNAKVNTICAQIAQQVGIEDGQAIMHFYLQQNVAWYVQKSHALEYALKDLQALRTNMLNNKAMSSREAQKVDVQQAQKNALQNYLENREKYALK